MLSRILFIIREQRAVALAATIVTAGAMAAFALTLSASAQSETEPWQAAVTGVTAGPGDDPGELLITWDAHPENANDYRVKWAEENGWFRPWDNTNWNAYPVPNSLTVTGLNPGDSYKVAVRARFDDGASNWSDLAIGAAAIDPMKPPVTGLSVEPGENSGELVINWDPHPAGPNDYRVKWAEEDGEFRRYGDRDWNAYPTGTTHTVTGLTPGATYKAMVLSRFDDRKRSDWTEAVTGPAALQPNLPAAGQPAITGTVEVDETLGVDTSGISDGNGMTNAEFSYQWIRSAEGADEDIAGETGIDYPLTEGDAGNAFKVRVSFTDDDGYSESVTSDATDVLLVAETQVASSGSEPDGEDLPADATTTGALVMGETATGNIGTGDDKDWFRVELTEGVYYRFRMKGAGTTDGTLENLDLRGIADEDGNYLTPSGSDNRGTANYARIEWKASQTGTFYLVAKSWGSQTGTYLVAASVISDGDTVPADTTTTTELAVGGWLLYVIETGSDRDWIKVEMAEDMWYRFELNTRNATGEMAGHFPGLFKIRDPEGAGIADTTMVFPHNTGPPYDRSETRVVMYFQAQTAGHHYVVAGSALNTTGMFTIKVEAMADDDHSADASTDGTVAVDGTVMARLEIPQDHDWFKIELEADKTYKVDVLGTSTGNGTLRNPGLNGIYDSSGQLVADTADNDRGAFMDARKYFTPSEGGTYYVAAASAWGTQVIPGNRGTYRVGVTEVASDIPGNTSTTATLTVGTDVFAEIDRPGDKDWYKFETEADKAYLIQARAGSQLYGNVGTPYALGIYDVDGNAVTDLGGGHRQNLNRKQGQLYLDPGQAATYYFSFGARGPTHSDAGFDVITPTGTYLARVIEVDDDLPGDDTTLAAAPLAGKHRGVFEMIGDHDWYKFTGTVGKAYFIKAHGNWSGHFNRRIDIDIDGVFDTERNRMPGTFAQWNAGLTTATYLDAMVYFVPTVTATYFIGVASPFTHYDDFGNYNLTVHELPPDLPDGTSTTAAVAVGGTYSGWIEQKRDRDWVRMTLIADEEYEIHARGKPTSDGSLRNPHIYKIADSTGQNIRGTSNADGGEGYNAMVTFTPTVSGDYYVEVGGEFIGPFLQYGTYTIEIVDVDGDGM